MINNIETLGLLINKITPNNNSINNNVNSKINIHFNSDLDTSSVIGNVSIFIDKNFEYTSEIDSSKLFSNTNFELVSGNISYDNRILTFTPTEPLKENSKYIIYINKNITDIRSKKLNNVYTYWFYTESEATLSPIKIINPSFGIVTDDIDKIEWESQITSTYILQISKQKTFETLIIENIIKANKNGEINSYLDIGNLAFEDGLYFVRVKSINGDWSNEHQFFIKRSKKEDAVVSNQDMPEDIVFDEDEDEELIILDYFPKEDDINISEKINIMYVKVLGELKIDDVNLDETYIAGELFDEEDEDSILPHGLIEYKFNVVYDSENDESYIIFILNEL